jgi:hypothetical protein
MNNEIREERVKTLAIGITIFAEEHGYSEAETCFACLVTAAGIAPPCMKREVMAFFADCLDGSEGVKLKEKE